MSVTPKILVFTELADGELGENGRGLLSYGARLAGFIGGSWGAVTPVLPEAAVFAEFEAYGTPAIIRMAGCVSLLDRPGLLGNALAQLVAEQSANLLVLPHNDLGATLAPVVAAALDAALLTEVVSGRNGTDGIHFSRQALGSRIAETKSWDGSRPLVITVPVRSLSQVLMPSVTPSTPAITTWEPVTMPAGASATIIDRIPPDPQTVDLTEAEVIFSVGKGCNPAIFEQFKELCRLLNVSYGVTRPVYDLGWTGFERMVGQTGRTVVPRLYLALGISGSMHHVGGIKDSKRIVAVNKDPKAPIFPNADEGFVADLGEVLPRLLEKAKAAAGGAA